jgi:predicted dehydrogenase
MKTFRGAIVGFGHVAAEAHVPGFLAGPGFEIVAVVDPSETRRAEALRRLPGVRAFADLDALLDARPGLDFLDVATPPKMHAAAATAGLDRGLHVLCEKPLAVGRDDLEAIAARARRSGRTVFTVHNWKHAPLFRRLRELVVAGAVGAPREFEWTVLRPNPPAGATADGRGWRTDPAVAGGGILVDHGWHAVYLAAFVLGRRPRAVRARVWQERPGRTQVEDSAEAVVDFGASRARLFFTWAARERRTGGALRGTAGEISIGDDRLEVVAGARAGERLVFSPGLAASSYHPEWFPPLLADFRAEITGAERRGRNLEEALDCAAVLAAAYASGGSEVALAREERGACLSS